MNDNITKTSIFNPVDKLSERKEFNKEEESISEEQDIINKIKEIKKEETKKRKEELIKKRKEVREVCRNIYKENTKEIVRQMQIVKTKNWKNNNPEALAIQKHRRYIWLKESSRIRNIML